MNYCVYIYFTYYLSCHGGLYPLWGIVFLYNILVFWKIYFAFKYNASQCFFLNRKAEGNAWGKSFVMIYPSTIPSAQWFIFRLKFNLITPLLLFHFSSLILRLSGYNNYARGKEISIILFLIRKANLGKCKS